MFIETTSLEPRSSIRERRSIEIRHFFSLPEPDAPTQYTIDRWFFFPRNVSVNADSWSTDEFYRSSQVLLRLQPVNLQLAHLSNLDDARNPGHALLERGRQLLEPVAGNGESMSAIAQLYGAELVDAIHDGVAQTRRCAERGTIGLRESTDGLIEGVFESLEALRRVRRAMMPYAPITHPEFIPSLEFAEEYSCAVVDEKLSGLAIQLGEMPHLRDGTASVVRCQLALARALERLNERRRDQGFVLPRRHNGENYSYRISLLKKQLQRSLYVDTRTSNRDPLVVNSAGMVAAGLAATWATIAQVPLFQANLTSAQGALIFAGAVGAYVLKDRIKDRVKNTLVKRWKPWDHDQKIVSHIFEHLDVGTIGGRSKERTRWTSEAKLPQNVAQVRQAQRTVRNTSTELEEVLHYNRELELTGAGGSEPSTLFGIQSIFRFSLADIMARLDDTKEEISYFDETAHSFRKSTVPRVYHVNIVQRTRNDKTGEEHMSRLRVVMNRKRVLRVEQVETDLD